MKQEKEWYRLDNAAKIIPSSMHGADTRVFRLVCELNEDVDPEILNTALEHTTDEFPYMNCCLRKGIFWYYMDEMDRSADVSEEHLNPLHALYVRGQKTLLYRLNYFGKRISLEMFHTLSDGTGGFIIFRHIICEYLILKYGIDPSILGEDTSSIDEKKQDAFSRYYESDKRKHRNYIKEMFPKKAYAIKGRLDPNLDEHLIEGTASAAGVLELAHKYHTTLGVFATSVWIEAILLMMKHSEYDHPIVVSVPVNLRQYFQSATTRNFFGVINVSFDPHKYKGDLADIISDVDKNFKEELTDEKMRDTMNSYSSLEHNIAVKAVPLFLKELGLRYIKSRMDGGVTTSVSNVGKVNMPPETDPYINKFASFMACSSEFMCISSYKDKMVFGITSCFENHSVPMNFFRRLNGMGVNVVIATNDYMTPPKDVKE